MKTWLLNHWDGLRNGLWFVPATGLLAALTTAFVMLRLDSDIRIETIPALGWATTTAPAARSTLSIMAGALVTVTGVVFSVTMLTLAQTSAMFGSRLLRSFLNHNVTQVTLATFLGTGLYCFAVLRSVREVQSGETFVPHLSIGVALLGGLACLAAFIYFIHHVAASIQAQTVVRNVADDLEDAIERLFPEGIGQSYDDVSRADVDALFDHGQTYIVEARSDGYIQAVDGDTLMEMAARNDSLISLLRRPGDFISMGTPLAQLARLPESTDDLDKEVNDCFLVGSRRTPRQDVACAVNELVEVAVRALSPGINDPHTAIACIDYLGAMLVRLAQRKTPCSQRQDSDGVLRLIAPATLFPDILNTAFDEIRQYGRSSRAVNIRLVETLQSIAGKVKRASDREAILRQADMIERGAYESLPEHCDRADIDERLRALRNLLRPVSDEAGPIS